MPPLAYNNPINAVTTKFVHLSLNKQRCPVNAVRWTPDGRRMMTGSSSGEFTLWNGTTFNFETILQAHDAAIRAMCWSRSGGFLVTGDHLGVMKVWQPSMNNLKVLTSHKEPVRQVSFAPSDSKFASCSDDGTLRVWDFATMADERVLSGHGWDVKTVHWHPFQALISSGSKDNLVKLWDPRTGDNVATLHGHKNAVLDVKWNANGNWLITASKDQIVKLFDIRTMREIITYRAHKKEVNAVSWHPVHETLFASGGAEGAIHFHTTSQVDPVGSLEGAHDGIVWSLDWHPLGHVLVSGSADCSARFWTRHRPGDSLLDRFTLGRAAAEALGISDAAVFPLANLQAQQELLLANEDSKSQIEPASIVLPGLGTERKPQVSVEVYSRSADIRKDQNSFQITRPVASTSSNNSSASGERNFEFYSKKNEHEAPSTSKYSNYHGTPEGVNSRPSMPPMMMRPLMPPPGWRPPPPPPGWRPGMPLPPFDSSMLPPQPPMYSSMSNANHNQGRSDGSANFPPSNSHQDQFFQNPNHQFNNNIRHSYDRNSETRPSNHSLQNANRGPSTSNHLIYRPNFESGNLRENTLNASHEMNEVNQNISTFGRNSRTHNYDAEYESNYPRPPPSSRARPPNWNGQNRNPYHDTGNDHRR